MFFFQYSRALHVLKECSRLKPRNTVVLLQAAKLCFECLHLVSVWVRGQDLNPCSF